MGKDFLQSSVNLKALITDRMENLPSDYFVKKYQFTRTTHRDVYPAVDPSKPENSQAGKVVVITGASKGIGRHGFVKSFAKAGPKGIVLVSRSETELFAVREEILAIDSGIEVLAVPTGSRSPESVAALWAKIKAKFGKADVLVNNGGTMQDGIISKIPLDTWWTDFETNIKGTFLMTQSFLELLGKERKGAIISLSSRMAFLPSAGRSAYSLTKLALVQMQAYVALENPNVTAIALHPGVVWTGMTTDQFKRFAKDTPELVGGVGVWLATEKASFLNGRYIEVNWDVDELTARKDEIVQEEKLVVDVKGEFGQEQFA